MSRRALAVSALLGALLVAVLVYQGLQISELRARLGEPADLETRKLEERLGMLEQELTMRGLGRDPAALRHAEAGPLPSAPIAFDAGDAEEIETSAGAVLEVLESYDPEVRDRLRAVIQEEQERLREERREARAERRRSRIDEAITALTERVEMSPERAETVRSLLIAEYDQRDALREQARETGDRRAVRGQMFALRDETDLTVRAELDDPQYEAYLEMRMEEGTGRGPRWGR